MSEKKKPNVIVNESKGMEPLGNGGTLINLVSNIEHFYNAEVDAYYSKSNEFGMPSSYILVPLGSNVDKSLRKEYPRGINGQHTQKQAWISPTCKTLRKS